MAMNRAAVSESAVALFHSLADPMRLTILRLLADGERRVVDLTAELGLAQSTVSGHLACLRSAGLVDAHPYGRSTYYALTRTAQLWPLLAAAERLLDTSGEAITLCPEHHRPEPVAECGVAVRGCVLHGYHAESPTPDGRAAHEYDGRDAHENDGRDAHENDGREHTSAGYPSGTRTAAPKRPGRH